MIETRTGSSFVRYISQFYNENTFASCWWWKVMFFFNLLFSIKGLWKVNWPVTEQFPAERHQGDITTLTDFFPWSTTQPWYNTCTYFFCILGYACQVKWWIKMIACLKPTLWYILGDFYMQQLSKHTYLNYNLQTSLGFTSFIQYKNSDRLQAITKNGRPRCSI